MIERIGIGQDAGAAESAIGRLQADQAARCRGYSDRTASIGSKRRHSQASCDGRPGACARAPAESVDVPGIAGDRKRQVGCQLARTGAEFPCIELAKEDGTNPTQSMMKRRILVGDEVKQQSRPSGRANALGVISVLQSVRNAVQRANGTTSKDGGFRRTCGGPSRLGRHSDITVKGAVELGYPRKKCLDELDRRELACGD